MSQMPPRQTLPRSQPDEAGASSTADVTAAPVNLKMLAKHLGLSKGTISRALNGYPEIAERTRARVLQAAEELGYKPNRAARRLATGRNDLISYIGVGADWMTVERSLLGALSKTLAADGYGLLVSVADTMESAEQTMRHLLEDRRVDGFVFSAAYPNDRRVDLAVETGMAAALLGGWGSRSSHTSAVPTIGINDSAVLDGLVDYLGSMGHNSFAYFGCDAPIATQIAHSETLAASCKNRNHVFNRTVRDASQIFEAEAAKGLTERAARLLQDGPPTAIFCGCERTVVAIYMAARDLGLSIPQELSIIGIGSQELASWMTEGLSTVSWSLSEAGRLAADCVMAQIEGGEMAEYAVAIEAQFVARSTHGPAPRSVSA